MKRLLAHSEDQGTVLNKCHPFTFPSELGLQSRLSVLREALPWLNVLGT